MKGLIVRDPWVDLILDGKKTWELRSTNTKIRGRIALIRAGSGKVVGSVELINSMIITIETFRRCSNKHCVEGTITPYSYAWVLQNPKRYKRERKYNHPSGAVIWVNL